MEEIKKDLICGGLNYFKKGNFEEGIKLSEAALALDKNDIDKWNLCGLMYLYIGKYSKAKEMFKSSIDIKVDENPANNYLEDTNNLILLLEKVRTVGKNEGVEILKNQILPHYQNNPALLNYVGLLFLEFGEKKSAIECWEKSVQVERNNFDALTYLRDIKTQKVSVISKIIEFIRKK